MSCRKCGTPKWRGSPCLNADCVVNTTPHVTLKSRTLPITATAKHGYHALNQTAMVTGYDAPIRATGWKGAR
jgi:hypothetical protein